MNTFGTIAQLGFVVRDLDEALQHWVGFHHVGPFYRADEIRPEDFRHRGHRHDVTFAAALANSGAMQIELVQPLDQAPSLWREFLDAGRTGLQHVAYWTDAYDDDLAAAERAGHQVAHRGVLSGGRFAYLDTADTSGYAIELSEQSPAKRALFGAVRRAAQDWDGSQPIRPWADAVALADHASSSAT